MKKGAANQEPYLWPTVTQVAIKTLNARYLILPYIYTLFYLASVNGGQVAQALLFQFPQDTNTWPIDQQFMLGSGILITPVLQQGATSVKGYFPDANWYNFWDGTPLGNTGFVTLNTPITDIQLHVLGGNVIPMQESAMTLYACRQNTYRLTVALDRSGAASGSIYLDDGDSVDASSTYTYVTYTVSSGTLRSTVVKSAYAVTPVLKTINVWGVAKCSSVTVNGATQQFTYNSTSQVLNIASLSLSITKEFNVTWS